MQVHKNYAKTPIKPLEFNGFDHLLVANSGRFQRYSPDSCKYPQLLRSDFANAVWFFVSSLLSSRNPILVLMMLTAFINLSVGIPITRSLFAAETSAQTSTNLTLSKSFVVMSNAPILMRYSIIDRQFANIQRESSFSCRNLSINQESR